MREKTNWILKNIHLIVSVVIVVPTGIIYGTPAVLPAFLDIPVNTIDIVNLLKANMMLYVGVSSVWILGVWKTEYWTKATELNILFMLALGIGRMLSLFTDGLPTDGYVFGIIAEFTIGLFSIYQLKRFGEL